MTMRGVVRNLVGVFKAGKSPKQLHFEELARKPKVVDSPDENEKGSDAWFHIDALYD